MDYSIETEYLLFADAAKVQDQTLIVYEENDPETGKVITWLGDLPLFKVYLTELGNKVERISDFEVKFDNKRIPFPVSKPRSRQHKVLTNVPQDGNASFKVRALKPLPAVRRLLEGEMEFLSIPDVELALTDTKQVSGILFLTNYQVLLQYVDKQNRMHEVCVAPLQTITRLEKVGGKKSVLQTKDRQIILHRKDFHREARIVMNNAAHGQRKLLLELINKLAFPADMKRLFAFHYRPKWELLEPNLPELTRTLKSEVNINCNGWRLFNPRTEMTRIGFAPEWRWSDANKDHAICRSYPELLAVPREMSDQALVKAAQFRTKGRLPMLSWIHPRTRASITRSSQPRVGALSSRCAEDELLINLIMTANPIKHNSLVILDARPRANAEVNRAVGAGYETSDHYKGTQTLFLDIANIHVMRGSQSSLRTLCNQSTMNDDSHWLSQVEATNWLSHIRSIFAGVLKLVRYVHLDGISVLVHCSDGWDRTAMCVSLAEICMDPFYRTLSGFCTLIEKEWISPGHMFHSRLGHGSSNHSDENRAPIFLQWVDCVWQLQRQYPTSFEFNESFLIRVIDEASNCRFGTFVTDNDQQKQQFHVERITQSLWSYIHRKDNFYRYINPLYCPPQTSSSVGGSATPPSSATKSEVVIYPRCSMKMLALWNAFYLRSRNYRDKSGELMLERVFEMQCKIDELQLRLNELQLENAELKANNGASNASSASNDANGGATGLKLTAQSPPPLVQRSSPTLGPSTSTQPAAVISVPSSTNPAMPPVLSVSPLGLGGLSGLGDYVGSAQSNRGLALSNITGMSLSDAMQKFSLLHAEPEEAPDVDDDPELTGTNEPDLEDQVLPPSSTMSASRGDEVSPQRERDDSPVPEPRSALTSSSGASQPAKPPRSIDRMAHRAISLSVPVHFASEPPSPAGSPSPTPATDPQRVTPPLQSPRGGAAKQVVMISGSLVEIDDNYKA